MLEHELLRNVNYRQCSGKYLSDIPLSALTSTTGQKDVKAKKGKDTSKLDQAIANKTGAWTTHGDDRVDN